MIKITRQVGVPWPFEGAQGNRYLVRDIRDDIMPNCYHNDRVMNEIGPRLRDALLKSKIRAVLFWNRKGTYVGTIVSLNKIGRLVRTKSGHKAIKILVMTL